MLTDLESWWNNHFDSTSLKPESGFDLVTVFRNMHFMLKSLLKYKTSISLHRLVIVIFEACCLCCPNDEPHRHCIFTTLSEDRIKLITTGMKTAKVVLIKDTKAAEEQKQAKKKADAQSRKEKLSAMSQAEREAFKKSEKAKRDKERAAKKKASHAKADVKSSPKLKSPRTTKRLQMLIVVKRDNGDLIEKPMEYLDDWNEVFDIASLCLSSNGVDVNTVLRSDVAQSSRCTMQQLWTKACTYVRGAPVSNLSSLKKQIGAAVVDVSRAKCKELFADDARADPAGGPGPAGSAVGGPF